MVTFRSVQTLLFKPNSVVESLIHKFPRLYLGCIVLLALFGYAFVLLFPLSVLAGLLNTYESFAVSEAINWQSALTWLAVTFIAALVSYRMTQIRLKPPVGLTLTEDKAADLFNLVKQQRVHFKQPVIHRIVITTNYELDIVKTPLCALPVWSADTMVIGLPVLQSLSPKQFECMVARRLGQFSKRDNVLFYWLYQLRAIWQQYRVIYSKQKGFGFEPLKWFFSVYAPFYAAASAHTARQQELHADSCAMELFNHEEVREMITADALCRWYLKNQFWPAVYKIASVDKKSLPTPHAKMAAAVHTNMNGEKLKNLMTRVISEKPLSRDTRPSLLDRINNIGHEKPRLGKYTVENAASFYLGTSIKGVIDLIDKLWLKSFLERRKLQRRPIQSKSEPKQATSS